MSRLFMRGHRILLAFAGIALALAIACGGGSSSSGSTTTPTAPTPAPTTPTNTWSVTGRVVDTMGQQPLSGAQISPSWDLAATASGSDGSYKLGAVANPNTNPYKVTVSGTDLVSHDIWIGWQRGDRNDVTLDAIRNVAPFSMDFYRQFVRGTYDQPGAPWPVLRWDVSPRFYLKTVDQSGRPIEPEVLQVVRDGLLRGFQHSLAADSAARSNPGRNRGRKPMGGSTSTSCETRTNAARVAGHSSAPIPV